MWLRLYTGAFLAPIDGEGGRESLSPFSFLVSGASRMLFETDSESAKPEWWKAGWINLVVQDASIPTFRAIEYWERLPLGESILTMPSQAIYQVRIEPVTYLHDISIKVWAEYL
jgi:hypothetical protein